MSGIIKTIKAKDEHDVQHNIFPKTVLEAVVDSETNETLDIILADKVSKTDIVDNLESTATNLPLSAKQGKVVNDNFNNYIAENLIPYPYFQTSCTNENIVYTDNGDGTINANGTATGSFSGFTCRLYNEGHLGYQLVLPKGTYTLSGCPDGGSGGTYFLQVGRNTGSWQTIATDIGEGATFTITEDVQVSVTIAIIGGTTVNNLIFKPMLEVGTVAHEYKPYTSTKLTKGDIVDNLLTGRADLPLSANQGREIKEFLDIKIGSVVWENDTYKPNAGQVFSVRQSGNIVHIYLIGGYSTGTVDFSGNNRKIATIQGVDYPPYIVRNYCMTTSGEIYNAQGASLGIVSITEDGGLYFSGISTTRNIIINITYLVENS